MGRVDPLALTRHCTSEQLLSGRVHLEAPRGLRPHWLQPGQTWSHLSFLAFYPLGQRLSGVLGQTGSTRPSRSTVASAYHPGAE